LTTVYTETFAMDRYVMVNEGNERKEGERRWKEGIWKDL